MLITVLLIASFICFILAAVNWPQVPVNLTALGLAFWVLSLLIAHAV